MLKIVVYKSYVRPAIFMAVKYGKYGAGEKIREEF